MFGFSGWGYISCLSSYSIKRVVRVLREYISAKSFQDAESK